MTPTRQEMLADIREACIKANPNYEGVTCPECGRSQDFKEEHEPCNGANCKYVGRFMRNEPDDFGLADVLHAAWIHGVMLYCRGTGTFYLPYGEGLSIRPSVTQEPYVDAEWNLRRDSLEQQSDPTLSFIHQPLCSK